MHRPPKQTLRRIYAPQHQATLQGGQGRTGQDVMGEARALAWLAIFIGMALIVGAIAGRML